MCCLFSASFEWWIFLWAYCHRSTFSCLQVGRRKKGILSKFPAFVTHRQCCNFVISTIVAHDADVSLCVPVFSSYHFYCHHFYCYWPLLNNLQALFCFASSWNWLWRFRAYRYDIMSRTHICILICRESWVVFAARWQLLWAYGQGSTFSCLHIWQYVMDVRIWWEPVLSLDRCWAARLKPLSIFTWERIIWTAFPFLLLPSRIITHEITASTGLPTRLNRFLQYL